MRAAGLIILASVLLLGFCADNRIPPSNLPIDLLYQRRPIPEPVLQWYFGGAIIGFGDIDSELDIPLAIAEYENALRTQKNYKVEFAEELDYQPSISFEWEYIGSLYNVFHVVRAYWWESGCMGKFTGLLVLKREGDILKIEEIIYGGERHSSMIFEGSTIENNTIFYSQGATTGSIMDIALELYPELAPIYEMSPKKNLCYGEACFYGWFDYSAQINPSGKLQEHKLLSYSAPEGCKWVEELYQQDGLKAVALDLLSEEE